MFLCLNIVADLSFNESNILPCTSWIYEGVEVSAVTEVVQETTNLRFLYKVTLSFVAENKVSRRENSSYQFNVQLNDKRIFYLACHTVCSD